MRMGIDRCRVAAHAALCATCVALLMAAPVPAHADDRGGVEGFMNGLNGVFTAVADPFAGFADPPDRYDELPLHQVTGRVLGFVEGTGMAVYRATTGVVDMVAAPLYVVPELSPEARFSIFVGDRGVSGSVGLAPSEGNRARVQRSSGSAAYRRGSVR